MKCLWKFLLVALFFPFRTIEVRPDSLDDLPPKNFGHPNKLEVYLTKRRGKEKRIGHVEIMRALSAEYAVFVPDSDVDCICPPHLIANYVLQSGRLAEKWLHIQEILNNRVQEIRHTFYIVMAFLLSMSSTVFAVISLWVAMHDSRGS